MTHSLGAPPGGGADGANGGGADGAGANGGGPGRAGHLVPLGRTGWSLWREGALRSAGFPAAGLLAVCDAELARVADEAGGGADEAGGGAVEAGGGAVEAGGGAGEARGAGRAAAYREAASRLSAAVARIAADSAFREAVAWQNPALIESCLDKLVRGEPRNVRGRQHESTLVRYLQRYLLKNDTIGFFGPVGWATLAPECAGMEVTPGGGLLAARTVHFEMWAVDEVARSLARRPELHGWLIPRRALAVTVSGGFLHRPLGPPVRLTEAEITLLRRCDGRRTAREVTSGPSGADATESAAGAQILGRLARLGAVHIGFDGPVDSWPERALRAKIEAIGEEPARTRALASVDALIAARDAAGAASTAEELVERTGKLAEIFGDLTGAEATRRHGQAYAGRTLMYTDTRRDVDVVAGRVLLGELAAPLGLLLDSARWLVARAASEYRELLGVMYQEEAERSGSPDVPLGYMITRAAPDLTASGHALPPPVQAAVEEFQRRWQQVLSWPGGLRRHSVSSAALAGPVQLEFGGAQVPWQSAVHHSPDILIAAASPEAVRRGEFLLVLGELHLAVNSLDNRFFVQHHDNPRRLLAAAEADADGQRIYAALPKSSPFVSSRVWPPVALLSGQYTYWSWSGEPCSVEPPGPVLAAGSLLVRRRDGALRVVCRDTGAEYDLLEVLGEILSTAVVNAFRPFAPAPHNPRITVDRLVISRESWTFPAADTGWAFVRDEAARYAAARAWRACYGLPERVFAVLPVERKPIGVDFTSLALVNILGKEIRRTAEAGAPAFSVSEMLPDLAEMWLPDRAGQRYASELRLVAFDEAAQNRGRRACPAPPWPASP